MGNCAFNRSKSYRPVSVVKNKIPNFVNWIFYRHTELLSLELLDKLLDLLEPLNYSKECVGVLHINITVLIRTISEEERVNKKLLVIDYMTRLINEIECVVACNSKNYNPIVIPMRLLEDNSTG